MTNDRALRPYPPASPVASDTGTATRVEWYNRNRLILALRKQSDPTETPEDGQTTTVKVYGDGMTLIHTETGLTGTSWDYDNADEIIDGGGLQNRLTFHVFAERDSYLSTFYNSTNFDRIDFVVVGADRVVIGGDAVIL